MATLLHTKFAETFGVDLPICLAPMAGQSDVELAVAVARAGGVGVLPAGYLAPESVMEKYKQAKERVGKDCGGKLGVGYLLFELRADSKKMDGFNQMLKQSPDVIWLTFDEPPEHDPSDIVRQIRRMCHANTQIIYQVNSVEGGLVVARAGVDAIVGQGLEAGGHQAFVKDPKSVFTLTPALRLMLDSNFNGTKRPCLLSAGGIVDGRSVVAALALGADGVAIGTRFSATWEGSGSSELKARLAAAKETSRTTFWDELGQQWPASYGGRSIVNALMDGSADSKDAKVQEKYQKGRNEENLDWVPVYAGQAVDRIRESDRTVEQVVKEILAEVKSVISSLTELNV